MGRCIFVIGTRAQLVKISPVLRIATERGLDHSVWFTGQHHESIDDLIVDFGLSSSVVQPQSAKERSSIGKLLLWMPSTVYRCFRYVRSTRAESKTRPLVVVHGDTLSTWLGAVAGTCGGGEIVHLESGLSSGKWSDPFPEELLRRLTFRISSYALCPNNEAAERMAAYPKCVVINTRENTLLDCVRYALRNDSPENESKAQIVVSIHRFQNIYRKARLERIVREVVQLAELGWVFFILHPPTELRLKKYGLLNELRNTENVKLLPRMPYTEFLALMGNARVVLSDGGSNQEELSYLGVPTILYRDRSERPDGLGGNIVFRHEIATSLADALRNGEIDSLRRESRICRDIQPSKLTVDALATWSTSPAGDTAH